MSLKSPTLRADSKTGSNGDKIKISANASVGFQSSRLRKSVMILIKLVRS